MPGPIIAATTSGALKAGIIAEFNRSYDIRQRERSPVIAKCFYETKSTRQIETHGGFDSVPVPKRWPRGQARKRSALSEFFVTVANVSWDVWVGWHEEDEEDDQTDKMVARAQEGAVRFSQLDERVMIQILTATTDPDLLASIPNAYDGAALIDTSTRFGVTGGNRLTGSGVGTSNAIRSDFVSAIGTKFSKFQDTVSQPYWTVEDVAFPNFAVIFNPANLEKFNDAFMASFLPAAPLGSSPVDNTWLSKNTPMLYPTQRITDNSWYILLVGANSAKPFVKQIRRDVRQLDQNPTNSDESRDTKEKGVGWDARFGYGVWEPRCAVKVYNA